MLSQSACITDHADNRTVGSMQVKLPYPTWRAGHLILMQKAWSRQREPRSLLAYTEPCLPLQVSFLILPILKIHSAPVNSPKGGRRG